MKEAYFSSCPQCSVKSFENLETYSHCVNCFYFEDYFEDLEKGYFSAIAAENLLESMEIDNPDASHADREVA